MKSSLLDKSFRILDHIASSPIPVTLKELAADLELNTSTASRIAADLVERKLIRKFGYHSFVPSTGLFRIGVSSFDTPLIKSVSSVMDERLAELGVDGMFAGIDNGCLVDMYSSRRGDQDWLPSRLPPWRSNLAAVILARMNDREKTDDFFRRTFVDDGKHNSFEQELTLLHERCAQAAREGCVVFKSHNLGWSVSFPVSAAGEVFGVAIFGPESDRGNLERKRFECSRLASKLASVIDELFY